MKLNITRELDATIRIRRIRVGFHARDINSNGCIDRSKIGLDADLTHLTNFHESHPTSYRINACSPLATHLSFF